MGHIYLLRHGESQANITNTIGLDTALTAFAIKDAQKIKYNTNKIFTSNKTRAKQTAKILFPNKTFKSYDVFNEIYFGDLEGNVLTDDLIAEFKENPLVIETKYHGDNVWKRAKEAIDKIEEIKRDYDGIITIVMHATLMECIFTYKLYGKVPDYIFNQDEFNIGNFKRYDYETCQMG